MALGSSFCEVLAPFRYVPVAESETDAGVELTWPHGDKTLVQIDHSSVVPENGHIETTTLYRVLILLEKIKRVTEFKLSYSQCVREDGGANATDTFRITLVDRNKYKCLGETGRATTCKSFFSKCAEKVKLSQFGLISPIFRWRFERVHGCLKVQKPYVCLLLATEVKAGQPLQIA